MAPETPGKALSGIGGKTKYQEKLLLIEEGMGYPWLTTLMSIDLP
jgi:hypothetical protein